MKHDPDALIGYAMAATIAALLLTLLGFGACGCGGSVDLPPTPQAPAEDAASGRLDATTGAPEAGEPDAASEGGNGEAGTPALCCTTGQNVLVCDPGEPWACDLRPTHPPFNCTMREVCNVGDSCQGFNGAGTVVECGR